MTRVMRAVMTLVMRAMTTMVMRAKTTSQLTHVGRIMKFRITRPQNNFFSRLKVITHKMCSSYNVHDCNTVNYSSHQYK